MGDENNNDEMPSDEEVREYLLAHPIGQSGESEVIPESWKDSMRQAISKIEERTRNIPTITYLLAYISALITVLILLELKTL